MVVKKEKSESGGVGGGFGDCRAVGDVIVRSAPARHRATK